MSKVLMKGNEAFAESCLRAAVSLAVIQLPHKLKSWNIYLGVWKKSVVSLFKPNQKLLESIWSLVQHQGGLAP